MYKDKEVNNVNNVFVNVRIKNYNRTTMRQDGMKSISLLMLAADLLR
jgi:hypothetical protein